METTADTSEDVRQQPTETQDSTPSSPPSSDIQIVTSVIAEMLRNIPENDAMRAGYRFCARETIRFLIEEEHLSPDDPIITELMSHLVQQQNCLGTVEQGSSSQRIDSAGNSPYCTTDDEGNDENTDPNLVLARSSRSRCDVENAILGANPTTSSATGNQNLT
ncbi:Uncharacterised protein g1894 [Pycnogonum litorale]